MYKPPITLSAMRLAEESSLCRILMLFGPQSPEAIRQVDRDLTKRHYPGVSPRGERGRQPWLAFLRELADHYGSDFPWEWTAESIPEELREKAFGEAPNLTEEEKAAKAFTKLAGKESSQANRRRDNRPVLKPLNAKPFAGFKG